MRALLIVDMQVGCFTGEPPRFDQEGTVQRINALAAATRRDGVAVFIQHTATEDGFTRGSDAWRLLPALDIRPEDIVVEKAACDAFLETGLDAILKQRGVSEVIIVGCATDFCVDTTVRSAASHGYAVVVAKDAHTTRDRPHLSAQGVITHHNYIWSDLLLPRGRKIRVITTEALVAEVKSTPLYASTNNTSPSPLSTSPTVQPSDSQPTFSSGGGE
jgi:nicotinamidase-related amidase